MKPLLAPAQVDDYKQKGYLIIKEFFPPSLIASLCKDVRFIIEAATKPYGIEVNSLLDQGLLTLREKNHDAASVIYQAVTRLLSLKKASSLDIVRQVAEELLDSRSLFITGESLRYDPPSEDNLLIPWHQDYTFIQDSRSSIIFWFPLRDLYHDSGGVKLLPQSHTKGIRLVTAEEPFPDQGARWVNLHEPVDETHAISSPPLRSGDVLLMDTLLLHRSRKNRSNEVRWTGQFRVGDFMHVSAIERLWSPGALGGVDFAVHHPEFVIELSEKD